MWSWRGSGSGGRGDSVAEAAVGRRRRSDCGFGDGGDELETTVRDGFRGCEGLPEAGGVAPVPHALRSESAGERERATLDLDFGGGEVGEASGEELFGAKSPAAQYVNNSK
ncbi:hypothetical protein Scep_004426 [Stephania cephalantha]|uniref:Uncharacterized protein n=1 Tax=Stephania cephalantha TaxID=152367 RepID=A0AAP0PVC9_9MAGN